jgi:hypothetical protein
MDSEAPKPMKKARRNILHKVGRKLEKFEQSFGIQTPTLSHGSGSSLSDLSSNRNYRDSQNNDEEEDTVSLQYNPHSESPKAVLSHTHSIFVKNIIQNSIEIFLGNRTDRQHSSTPSTDSDSNSQWHLNTDTCNKILHLNVND